MIDWITSMFSDATAELIFLAICVGGGIVSGFSLLFGSDADGGADFDTDFDVDSSADGGDGGGGEGPGVFSIRGMALLATGFGGVAFIVQHYTGKLLMACVAGLLSGWLFAAVGLAFVRIFFRQQASSLITTKQMTGAPGIVTTTIPPGGSGEVQFTVAGQQISRTATSADDELLETNVRVEVVESLGGTVVVKKKSAES